MPTIALGIGTVEYRTFGPADGTDGGGPTAVFVHGFLTNGTLWDAVAERLAAAGVPSVVPDWPLGSHVRPSDGPELSPRSVASAIDELCDRLDLHDVVLVGNDTGGGLCQLALVEPSRGCLLYTSPSPRD